MAGRSPERTSAYAWAAEMFSCSATSGRVRNRGGIEAPGAAAAWSVVRDRTAPSMAPSASAPSSRLWTTRHASVRYRPECPRLDQTTARGDHVDVDTAEN